MSFLFPEWRQNIETTTRVNKAVVWKSNATRDIAFSDSDGDVDDAPYGMSETLVSASIETVSIFLTSVTETRTLTDERMFVKATTPSISARIEATTTLRSQKAGLYPSPARATKTDPRAEKRLTHSIAEGWCCGTKQSTTDARSPSDSGWIEKFKA
ncbi:hypothetical protein Daus18300_012342 [Diaporthe australafricana]|uniref:Uncharacterized protein n=1 Tax=Diaporthe australafricana TaxID=127596 RepID=A0ABR3W362_9PEZI